MYRGGKGIMLKNMGGWKMMSDYTFVDLLIVNQKVSWFVECLVFLIPIPRP